MLDLVRDRWPQQATLPFINNTVRCKISAPSGSPPPQLATTIPLTTASSKGGVANVAVWPFSCWQDQLFMATGKLLLITATVPKKGK